MNSAGFVTPEARGNHYAHLLALAALSVASNRGVFATSRTDNATIHNTLVKLGFALSGAPYKSARGQYSLQLFTRMSPTRGRMDEM